ncbi:MAG TPA: sigma-54-dependent Fis family transcriptional regulator, partial [Myxococcales bacterium]|nr:sigma-54-dependent Fis family transcriptional regulator [Myxococcales bacterium]
MAESIAFDHRVTAESLPQSGPAPALWLQWPGGAGQLVEPVCVGADPANQVVLDDRHVSAFHCRLHPRDGRWHLTDLGSTNGTFLDGARVAEAQVEPGARIRVGSQELRLSRPPARMATAMPGLLAHDPALAPALELLRRAAPSSLPVMILGESGTGKEVAARAVHELSPRRGGPFVPVNCGAISRELAEAELFGHEKGSFTGAITSAPGAFGAADGGTLFLDEIADLPAPLQVKLLRALEAGEVKPVGAARPRTIDVRVVCATHQDLRGRVREGAFREDLFYRLRGVTVELPPLRARPADILPLAEHFLPPQCTFAPDAR